MHRGEGRKEGGERKGGREEGREGGREGRGREGGREEGVWGEIKDVGKCCISLYPHHTNEGYRERRNLIRVAGSIL